MHISYHPNKIQSIQLRHLILIKEKIMTSHLAPDEHRAKDDLKAVEEVVSDDDDGAAT